LLLISIDSLKLKALEIRFNTTNILDDLKSASGINIFPSLRCCGGFEVTWHIVSGGIEELQKT